MGSIYLFYTAVVTYNSHNAFQWDRQPTKIFRSSWDLDAHLIHGSLGLPKSTLQLTSQLVQLFLEGLRM